MMGLRQIKLLIIVSMLFMFSIPVYADSNVEYPIELSDAEKQWLTENQDKEFVLGFDPYAGMEYFLYLEDEYGVVLDLADELERDLNIQIKLLKDQSWGEVFQGLRNGEVDILLGANETPERLEYMTFTEPVYRIPYAVMSMRDGDVFTLGDINGKKVGFIEGDIVVDLLSDMYQNINYTIVYFESQNQALEALDFGTIDAIVSSGGSVVFDYIDQYPDLKQVTELKTITSDMTLSTLKSNSILTNILDKEIEYLKNTSLPEIIKKSEIQYNHKVMKLTEKEIDWIKKNETYIAGVPTGYLPIDYYNEGEYGGMAGAVLREVGKFTGLKFAGEQGEFDDLMEKVRVDELHILDMVMTDDRLNDFIFTEPFSSERDIIAGRKDGDYVEDIYALEGEKVAVVEGYWHEEHLKRNLLDPRIVFTKDISESLKYVASGKADYLIENPSVIKYYIEELDLYNVVEMGNTSKNSYFRFGVSAKQPYLASIIDKSLKFIDLDKVMRDGFVEVPHTSQKDSLIKWILLSVGLVVILVILGLIVVRLIRALIKSKAKTEALEAKEKYIYEDAMTKLFNRHYLYFKVEPYINKWTFPQTIAICDLNNLKHVNDKYGHAAGDKYLKDFSEIMLETFPEGTILIRMGGDEFLVVLLGITAAKGIGYTEELIRKCNEIELLGVENAGITPSTAVGIASRNESYKTFEDLLKEADNNMYEHKRESKINNI